jgi:hypothetical protein
MATSSTGVVAIVNKLRQLGCREEACNDISRLDVDDIRSMSIQQWQHAQMAGHVIGTAIYNFIQRFAVASVAHDSSLTPPSPHGLDLSTTPYDT